MSLTLEVMARVLPPGRPPWEPSTAAERRKAEFLRARDEGDGTFSRGYFWQKHLTSQLREARSWLSDSLTGLAYPHDLLRQAVGYIEIDAAFASDEAVQRAARGTGYFFGAIVYDHRGDADGLPSSRDIGQIDEASRGIPAVRLAAADIPHAPHPAGATSTCWTAKRRNGGFIRYSLTAKHAVAGLGRGQTVAMAGGGFGRLVDFCDGSVDAALFEPPSGPRSAIPLAMDIDPAVGLDVNFIGAGTPLRAGRITKTWVFPTDPDPYDPQRVHLDVTGVPGDSGALVRLTSTGEAVGIYTGIKSGRSSQSGMSQAIWQAAELLNIDLYE